MICNRKVLLLVYLCVRIEITILQILNFFFSFFGSHLSLGNRRSPQSGYSLQMTDGGSGIE